MTIIRVSPAWLALREPADAAARAGQLVTELRRRLPRGRPLVVHDLGCGTGAMLRWLAPQLPQPQHWVLHDHDPALLASATAAPSLAAADGSPVTSEALRDDVTRMSADELNGAGLITTSSLLDVLTADELDRLIACCVRAGCPALLTLTVTGRVELWPPAPPDAAVRLAFNAHQRRTTADGRKLLGPDAARLASRTFTALGAEVLVWPSPWRLGRTDRALTVEWFTGWLAAACTHRPELAAQTRHYAQQRVADAAAGRLRATVHHRDLLVWQR